MGVSAVPLRWFSSAFLGFGFVARLPWYRTPNHFKTACVFDPNGLLVVIAVMAES